MFGFRLFVILVVLPVFVHGEEWRAGGEGGVLTANLPKPARVFLPENWDGKSAMAAIFFYPWTGGDADIEMMRSHTGGRDFIIVGMPKREEGAFTYSPEIVKLEQLALREVRDKLAAEVRLDPARIFVAGFSKGGWLSALLLAHEPGLAGGLVLGGGWSDRQHSPPQKFKKPVYVYIGDGRMDGNFPPSLRASREFSALGGKVTLDVWPATGHALPPGGSEGMRQWLSLIGRGVAVRDEAGKWAAREWTRISATSDAVDEWEELRTFSSRPYTRMLGGEWTAKIDARLATLLKQPAVATEAALDRELSAIHLREIRDMRVTTLEAVGPKYEELAKRAAGTRTGRLAEHDAGRIKKLWSTVK